MIDTLKKIIQFIKSFLRNKLKYESDDLPYYLTIIVAIVLFGMGTNLFLDLTESLEEKNLEPYDTDIFNFISSYRSENLTKIYRVVTDLGDRITYIILTIALAAYLWIRLKNWRITAEVVFVLVLAAATNLLLKEIINRERPSHEHLVTVNTLSFPSGHSMSAMAFYGFLIYLCMKFKMRRIVRILLITLLILLIVNIGISRIYLGVHYPSDVAAGMMGGLIWVTCCIIVFNVIDLYRKKKTH